MIPQITLNCRWVAGRGATITRFEEIFGEARIRCFPDTLCQNILSVGYVFEGWRSSVDRLVEEAGFQASSAKIVANCTFGFFSMPEDIGTQLILRAWWRQKNPKLALAVNFDKFVHDASREMMAGLIKTWRRTCALHPDASASGQAFYMDSIKGALIARKGKLNPMLKK